MTKQQKIINFISLIRNSHPEMVNIFSFGSCFNFYLILRNVWPESIPYYNINHVITKIDNNYYDISGQLSSNTIKKNNYTEFFKVYDKKGTKRAMRQMAFNRNRYRLVDLDKLNELMKRNYD